MESVRDALEKLVPILTGLATGVIGYWFTTFWMKPILRYRELRSSIHSDFIFYAQVIKPDGLVQRMVDLYERRVESNRKNSADLSACILELPGWYLWYLHTRGYTPEHAPPDLIGFSNNTDYDEARARRDRIKKSLGLKITDDL